MKNWKCTQCGKLHKSEEIPEKCTQCGNQEFEEMEEKKGFIFRKEPKDKLKLPKIILVIMVITLIFLLGVLILSIQSKSKPIENVKEKSSTEEVKPDEELQEGKEAEETTTPVEKEAPEVKEAEETTTPVEKEVFQKATHQPIIKKFSIDSRNLVVKLRKVEYRWKRINVDPFLEACKDWLMKDRIYLAIEKAGWDEKVADGLWKQIKLAMETNEKEGVVTREVKKGEILQWMYSGGKNGDTITLDIGKITVNIEHYYEYNSKGARKKVKMKKNDHINTKSYTFTYEGKVYELLWFEGSLGGISQCGNLAGRSFPATK